MAAEAREPCGEAVLNQKFVKKIDNENEPSAARKGSVSALFEESGEIAPVDVGGVRNACRGDHCARCAPPQIASVAKSCRWLVSRFRSSHALAAVSMRTSESKGH